MSDTIAAQIATTVIHITRIVAGGAKRHIPADVKAYMKSWTHRRTRRIIQIVGGILAFIISFTGLLFGMWAYEEYRLDNRLARASQLQERDQQLYALMFEKPFFTAFWAMDSDPHQLVGRFYEDMPEYKESPLAWNTIAELESVIYERFDCPRLSRLRQGHLFGELILYLVYDAHTSFQEEVISPDEWLDYASYIIDVGDHPLFLMGVRYGHQGKYFSEAFAAELRRLMMQSPEQWLRIVTMYPEIQRDTWAEECRRDRFRDIHPYRTRVNKN